MFNMRKTVVCSSLLFISLLVAGFVSEAYPAELLVGAATVDITPSLPVALDGQMQLRVATQAETPLSANVVVMESRGAASPATVFVSCDLVTIPIELLELTRQAVAKKLPALDPKKIIMNATHTHTAAVVRDGWYTIPEGVTKVKDYQIFVADQIAGAVMQAWDKRKLGTMSWGLGYANVAYNRRAVYADGSAKMYGDTRTPEFRRIEGPEDQSINTLFFMDTSGKLIAACINVASPAQVVEGRSAVNADYWHPLRILLQKRFGKDLCVLGWIGAAGDQCPRAMFNQAAEVRMMELANGSYRKANGNKNTDLRSNAYLDEVARRIVAAVISTYETVKSDTYRDIEFVHTVETIQLPARLVTEEEYLLAKKARDQDRDDPKTAVPFSRRIAWNQEVMTRFETQKSNPQPKYPAEVHVVRMGDVVLCTNPFELFTEYGTQMKARSRALQTIVLQLAGPGTYLPTKEAVGGGHYSAIVQSSRVGPEGGQALVEYTVEKINKLWP